MSGPPVPPGGAVEAAGPIGLAVFALLCLVVVASAIAVVTRRNPVSCIAWLVVHFVATACAYILMHSQFLGAVQVLVYAGAILVLFLFVIMLLSADRDPEPRPGSGAGRKALVACLLLALFTLLARVGLAPGAPPGAAPASAAADPRAVPEDSVEWLAGELFSRHLVAFEAASLILIVAMAGVMVYTTRRVPVAPAGRTRP